MKIYSGIDGKLMKKENFRSSLEYNILMHIKNIILHLMHAYYTHAFWKVDENSLTNMIFLAKMYAIINPCLLQYFFLWKNET
jgi:hypothetical protein